MFYPGPERYQAYEGRPSQVRNDPDYYPNPNPYPYPYRPRMQPNYPPPPTREFYGYMQTENIPRVESADQGDELLNRLEQTGRVPSKDKFRRMACNVSVLLSRQ